MNTVFAFCLFLLVATAFAQDMPKYCVKNITGCQAMVKKGLNVTCVNSSKADCPADVAKGVADLAFAKANDLVANFAKLKIVLAENVGLSNFVKYYGLAVVKKGSSLKLTDLKGKKTCHTGAGKTVGWVIPVGYLLNKKTMPQLANQWKSAADYFGGSCVPGVKDKTSDAAVTKKLCQLCKNPSACSSKDEYADYVGAMKCMADGKGEVAFVKHNTAEELFKKYPGKYGQQSNYSLLCKDGTMKELDQFAKCYIDVRPAHSIVTNKDNAASVANYRMIIGAVNVSDLVANGMLGSHALSLDVHDETTEKYLGNYLKYKQILAETKDPGGSSSTFAVSLALQIVAFFFISFAF